MKGLEYKKSQAAMEFLMTYGWAILVVLAAIAALAYFGVLSPEKFLPENCKIAPGINCAGFKVSTGSTTLVLQNGYGKDLIIDSITVKDCTQSFTGDQSILDNGDMKTFVLTGCTNGDVGDRFKGDILISYTEEYTNLTKTISDGTITTKVIVT